jgi:Fe-S cluster assembly protein SufD
VEQATGSRFTSRSFALGSGLTRNELSVLLGAPEAECELLGLYVLDGRAHVDNHLDVDHARPRCTSRQLYKGVVTGASRAVFDGRILVREGAAKTDARQTNKNLLLSDDATVDTKPNLRIYADDVKCAHGAAVGRLDEEAIFYLRSRGIDEAAARAVLTLAFTREVVDGVHLDALRARILRLVRAKLGMSAEGGEA